MLAVERALAQVVGLDVERRRRGAGRDISRLWKHPVARTRRGSGAASAAARRGARRSPSSVAVGVDQLGRGLLADAGDAGQVVARVAAQRRVLGVLRGRDAGALDDAGLVVERVVGDAALVVEHLEVRVAHELVRVAVAGDDDRRRCPRPRRASASVAITSSASTPVDLEQRDLAASRAPRGSAAAATRKRSGVSLRPALYSASISLRNVRPPGASNATAMWSGCSSASTFMSIDVKPYTAFVTVPDERREVGRAARRRPGTRASGRRAGAAASAIAAADRYVRTCAERPPAHDGRRAPVTGVSSPVEDASRRDLVRSCARGPSPAVWRKRHDACSVEAVLVHQPALGPVDDLARLEPLGEVADLVLERDELARSGRAPSRSRG